MRKSMSSVCPKCSERFSTPDRLPIILPSCLHHLCSVCITGFRENGSGKVICFVNECAASIREEEEFLSPDFHLLGYLSVHGDQDASHEGNMSDNAVQFISQIDNIGDVSCVRCSKISQLSCSTCKTEFCSDECFNLYHITPVLATHHPTPHEFVQNVCKEHGECFRYVAVDDLKLGCAGCICSGELRTKKVVSFNSVMDELKTQENLKHMVDVSNQAIWRMLMFDQQLGTGLQMHTMPSLLLDNTRRLESHIQKCHRMLQVVEVKAINDIKEAHEVRVQGLVDKRTRLEEEMNNLQQLVDAMEAKVDDDNDKGDQDIDLAQIVSRIEKLAEEHYIDNNEGEVAVNIDMSIFRSIVNHISVQKINTDPIQEESKSITRPALKQSLLELVQRIWEKEVGDLQKESIEYELHGIVDVILMHVDSPESFYVMMTKNVQVADSLRVLIQKEWDEGEKGNVTRGDMAVFKDHSEAFHRAKIMSLDTDLAWVQIIDRGNYFQASLSSLVKLSKNTCEIPPLVHHCCLAGVESEYEWDEAAAKGITQFFSNDVAKAVVMGNQTSINKVVITKIEDKAEIGLREFLAFRELASKDEGDGVFQPPHFRSFFYFPLDTSTSMKNVKVVLVTDPCQMFVNLVGNDQSCLKYLESMVNEMHEEYNDMDDMHAVLVPYVGLVCVTKYDERFFRAEVLEVMSGIVKVKFVDVGSEHIVHFSLLRRIPDKFLKLPAMAISVGLAGIKAPQDTWSVEAVDYLKEVLINQLTRMEILRIEGKHYLVEMFMKFIDSACEKSLNKMLIQKGYAIGVPGEDAVSEEEIINSTSLLERPDLTSGTKYSCRVVSASSPDSICLRRMDEEESFYRFHSEMNTTKSYASDLSRIWQEGDSCLVKIPAVGWARSRLLKIKDGEMAELLLFDYGRKITSALDDLKPTPSTFSEIWPYSWSVQLSRIRPTGGQETWTNTTCEVMQEILEDAGMVVDIELLERGDQDVWHAELYVHQIEVNSGPLDPDCNKFIPLSQMLVDRGLALPVVNVGCDQGGMDDVQDKGLGCEVIIDDGTVSGEAKSYDSGFCWVKAKLPSQSKFVGSVSHVDWDCNLYLSSLVDNSETLRIIGSVLNNKYSGSSPSQHDMQWSQGEACVAQFSIDQKWYRGQVLEVQDTQCLVMFVDYGSEELCKPQNMRKGLFMKDTPVQCFTVQLEIAPITSKWEKGVLDFIHMTIIDRPLNVTVLQDSEGFPLVVKMVTQAGLDLRDVLVSNGYARLNSIKAED